MRIEINWDADEHTYLLSPNFTHIPPLELGEDDFLLLSYLQQCISQHSETDIDRMMNESFKKIFGLLTGTKRWAEFAQHIHFRFDARLSASSRREDEIFRILYRASRDRKVIKGREMAESGDLVFYRVPDQQHLRKVRLRSIVPAVVERPRFQA